MRQDEILCEFQLQKVSWEFSCTFAGTSIGMPVYPGNNFFVKFSHLKFGCSKNSQEMLDQNTEITKASSWPNPCIW